MKNRKVFKLTLLVAVALTFCSCGKANSEISIHTEAQSLYLEGDYKNFKAYANGTDELSKPAGITLKVSGETVVSEDENFETLNVPSSFINKNDEGILIQNLKVGTTYYYKDESGKVKSFTTKADAPRNLDIEGVTNFRDLGGWKTADNTYVNQNLIFRSSKFNKDESTDLMITDKGISMLVNDLGIRTEIDLRTVEDNENGGITESPLGSAVTYVSIPFESGGNIILLNKDKLPALFEILGNKDNYPIVFHCSIGTDRTGMVAFLINGLCGVSEDDLYTDFLFSNFGNIGKLRTPSIIKTYIETVEVASGDTLSDKIFNYLKGVGVSESDMNSLKSIMTE